MGEGELPGESDVDLSELEDLLKDIRTDVRSIKSLLTLVVGDPTAAARAGHSIYSLMMGSNLSQMAAFDPIANAIMSLPSESPDSAGIDQDGNLLVYLKDFLISNPPGAMFGYPEYEMVADAYYKYLDVDNIKDDTELEKTNEMLDALRSKGTGFLSAAKLLFPNIKLLTWDEYKNTLYNKTLSDEYYRRKDLDNNNAIYGVDFKFIQTECPYGLTNLNSQLNGVLNAIGLTEYVAGRGI